MDYQAPPKRITRAKLVREIAKQLKKFIEVSTDPFLQLRAVDRLPFQIKRFDPIDPVDAIYQVGPGGIDLPHISIASLEQISKGSWQPRFVLDGL